MTFIKLKIPAVLLALLFTCSLIASPPSKKKDNGQDKDTLKTNNFDGLKFRSIGPAYTSGRIADFAVNPKNHSEYFVAVASGNVWKTNNNGTTFTPVFDKYGAYSIGCVTMDPGNHNVVWLGTGENNHQRALGYGDGVYKSKDGGKNWKNMGLKESRNIGGIVVDPENSDIVFVAAEGSAWGPGGDRGLYKSDDGGETWKKVIDISENTGINNIVIDPVNSSILYATSEQRRRHVHTKIGGGPESSVYKSTDNGETWRKIVEGLPSVDMGGMGIAVSPADHNIVYLIVEAAENKGGFYRSTDQGESWNRMNDYATSGQYYNEIYCDPLNENVVYSMDTYTQFTDDGGKTWQRLGLENRHVDDHAIWIDPDDTDHLFIGGDGGIYETYDRGQKWLFKSNLPVTQFYRVQVDNAKPFYNVFGGTQDNNSFGGPSQNFSTDGVSSEEWYPLLGGDGFWVQIDPDNPDIIYCEYQYGNMFRFDKKTGEQLDIKPRPGKGEKTYKWNWNTPLIISPHSKTRIYAAANKIFRSDDRGDSWQVISDDITSGTDRNTWPVMGQYWSVDAVAKDVSTSLFGTAVSLEESPVQEDLLFAGTDDGVISITEDAGKTWRLVKTFTGIPEYTYISDILASKHDANVVYASFSNLKKDDFKPYILKSTDKGKTWNSISADLPVNGSVHSLQQDFVNENLLFAGTEFGIFFSADGGKEWQQLKSGIPTVAVYDIAIQKNESDLVLATFGRGFYILDDYSPLREYAADKNLVEKETHMFDIPDALMYIQTEGKYGQGATLFHAPNPEFGAVFTYYLKESPKSLKEIRQEEEKKLIKDKKPVPQPEYQMLIKESEEVSPYLIFTITDTDGNVVRRINQKATKGINRVYWNLRFDSPYPAKGNGKFDPVTKTADGMLALPGKYKVRMSLIERNEERILYDEKEFETVVLDNASIQVKDRKETLEFQNEIYELARIMRGTESLAEESLGKIILMKQTLATSSKSSMELMLEAIRIETELKEILHTFNGPEPVASWEELPPMDKPLNNRLRSVVFSSWYTTYGVTGTMLKSLSVLKEEFPPVHNKLKLLLADIVKFESELEISKIQWTPGRLPILN